MKRRMLYDLHKQKKIAIVRGLQPNQAVAAAEALYAAGVRFVQVAFGTDKSDEECAKTLLAVYLAVGEKMYVGAAEVTTNRRLLYAMENGACFIHSPGSDAQIMQETVRNGLLCVAGTLPPARWDSLAVPDGVTVVGFSEEAEGLQIL